MPYLSLVHLRDARCEVCGDELARAGARSIIVDSSGNPMAFSHEDPPAEMVVEFRCANGHELELNVPNDIAAEETLRTPDDAPIGADARVLDGVTEGGKALTRPI